MKSLLFLIIVLFSGVSTAQNTRLFYQSPQVVGSQNKSTIALRNGIPYFFSLNQTDGDFIKLVYGEIDTISLSPVSYNYLTLPIQKNDFKYLNGVNVSNNQLELAIMSKNSSSQNRIVFLEIDLSTNVVLNNYSSPYEYRSGFYKAHVINQKLVLYGMNGVHQRLVRFEKEIGNNFATDTVPQNFSSTTILQSKATNLLEFNNAEYVTFTRSGTEGFFIKRSS